MAGLRVAPGLVLPVEAVTQTFGILAKRGVGKTYTASVMAEEMADNGLPFVAVDPIGVWWGLRATADGEEGYPIPVLGGEHGDLPLEKGAGEVIADLVVDERVSCVLDLGQFRKGEAISFMTAFAERLYHRNREPLHLFLDEADAFAPQKTMKGVGAERLLGAIEDIVRRGRARGLGCTLITQRPAVLNKNVLTQIETLVVHRIVSPQDRKAIDEWVEIHADRDEAREVRASLASLEIGESWWWSPGWLEILKRVQVRERHSFDSSATPKAGQQRREPKTLADVDLGALEKRMAETVERKKANDPKELHRRIRELESELAKKPGAEPEVLRVEVPVLPDFLLSRLMDVQGLARPAAAQAASVLEEIDKLRADTESFAAESGQRSRSRVEERKPGAAAVRDRREPGGQRARRATPAARPTPPAAGSSSNGEVTGPQQRVLDALRWWEDVGYPEPSKGQVGFIAGYRVSKKVGGTYGNILGQLRSVDLIAYPAAGTVKLTDDGRAQATDPQIPPTTEGLQTAVYARLDGPEQRVLREIVDVYPQEISKKEAGERAGYTVGEKIGGTYGNILGRLRSLGLVEYPEAGYVVAQPILFLDG